MAARAFDVVIVHEPDAGEWVDRLARGLERGGLRTTSVKAAAVDRAVSDPAITEAPILVVAVGRSIGAAIDAADAIYDKTGRPPGGVVPVQLPRAVLGSASVLRDRTGAGVVDLKKEETFDEEVGKLAASLRSRISRPVTKGAPTPPDLTTDEQAVVSAARRSSDQTGAILERAWGFAQIAEQNRVHVPYVFRALYEGDSISREAMRAAADPPDRFLTTLEERERRTESSDPVQPLPGLPPLSGHVIDGLVAAAEVATDERSDRIDPIHLLLGMLSVERCSTVRALKENGLSQERVRAAFASTGAGRTDQQPDVRAVLEPRDFVAGYANDEIAGKDLLDITNEVEALSTLLASRALEPPLALGLFGDWGSGKTFFMTKLQDRIREKALYERAKPQPRTKISYCESIVQLKFNAWHYIDKDLWASLANAIFEGLDEAVMTKDFGADRLESRTKKRLRLLAEQDANRRSLEQVEHDQAAAQAAVQAATTRLSELDSADDELARSVGAGEIVAGIYRVATAVPEVSAQIGGIARRVEVGVAEAAGTLGIEEADLRADLASGLSGRLRTAWRSLRKRRDLQLVALLATIALGAVVLVLWAAGQPLIALLAAAVVPVLSALGAAWVVAAPVMRIVSEARRESRQLIEKRRVKAKDAVEARRKQAEALIAAKQPELDERARRDADLAAQIRETEPGEAMAQFIRMRRASTAYTSRLGVVAQARDDFEQLSAYLAAEAKEGPVLDQKTGQPVVPAVERIVLYIDDLDRCTEKQVVDVLQAVHLLLAFKLFVVVVAVDPRWLLHSLKVRSRALNQRPAGEKAAEGDSESPGDDVDTAVEWEATPMDYLEKIFQVPFALWPMDGKGFARVIADLSRDKAGGHPEVSTEPGLDGKGETDQQAADESVPITDADTPIDEGSDTEPDTTEVGARTSENVESVAAVGAASATTPEVDPDVLRISDAEQRFMTLLHALIPTPRSAKRFVNVYRLLKASKAREGKHDFDDAAAHRPVLLLLAVVTGFPDLAPAILEAIHLAGAVEGSVWEIIDGVRDKDRENPETERRTAKQWEELEPRLAEVKRRISEADAKLSEPPPALDARLFQEWALAAARYSFESSRVLLQYRAPASESDESAEPEPAASSA